MALKTNKLAAAAMVAAAFSMLATPAEARGWGRWHGHRDRVDTGDVLAGVLILGGIAAIASAASKQSRQERYPAPYPEPQPRYQTPGNYERDQSRGMDRAVDICVAEVERRSGRIGTVDGANRNPQGWQVSGALANGRSYSCWIGNDGQVSNVDVGDGSAYAAPADGQWSNEAYAQARAAQDAPAPEADAHDDGRYDTAQAPDFGG